MPCRDSESYSHTPRPHRTGSACKRGRTLPQRPAARNQVAHRIRQFRLCGDIVGESDLPGPTPQVHHAVLWKHGQMVDLGVLAGDSCSTAYSVNSHGQIVGSSTDQELCGRAGKHAVLWESGEPTDLNTLIPSGASLKLTFAFAINDRVPGVMGRLGLAYYSPPRPPLGLGC
jgi:probable HAF family extracellular repeat protein